MSVQSSVDAHACSNEKVSFLEHLPDESKARRHCLWNALSLGQIRRNRRCDTNELMFLFLNR